MSTYVVPRNRKTLLVYHRQLWISTDRTLALTWSVMFVIGRVEDTFPKIEIMTVFTAA